MKLQIQMPWEKDLSVNHMRFGKPSPKARGKWKKRRVRRPHVQAWMDRLAWEIKASMLTGHKRWRVPNRYELMSESLVCRYVLPVHILVDFRFPDNRRRDDHNYFFCIANAVAAGLGIDDKDIRISTGSVSVDRQRPGFSITVEDKQ